jgi:hypothetical protein
VSKLPWFYDDAMDCHFDRTACQIACLHYLKTVALTGLFLVV